MTSRVAQRSFVTQRSLARAGKLVPPNAKRLRGRAIILRPGEAVEWHSTGAREELIIALAGTVRLELGRVVRPHTALLRAGRCAFIPSATIHRVVNRTTRTAHYLYVTG